MDNINPKNHVCPITCVSGVKEEPFQVSYLENWYPEPKEEATAA